jgi:hypothetical protein
MYFSFSWCQAATSRQWFNGRLACCVGRDGGETYNSDVQLSATIPTRAQIIYGGFEVTIAKAGTEWSKMQLGHYADKSGVYVLHANGEILYVGRTTTGRFGTFGERLRRHCQEKASGNSPLFQTLCTCTPPVRAYLLDLDDIDMMMDVGAMTLKPGRKALIMEQILIGIYQPRLNRADADVDDE